MNPAILLMFGALAIALGERFQRSGVPVGKEFEKDVRVGSRLVIENKKGRFVLGVNEKGDCQLLAQQKGKGRIEFVLTDRSRVELSHFKGGASVAIESLGDDRIFLGTAKGGDGVGMGMLVDHTAFTIADAKGRTVGIANLGRAGEGQLTIHNQKGVPVVGMRGRPALGGQIAIRNRSAARAVDVGALRRGFLGLRLFALDGTTAFRAGSMRGRSDVIIYSGASEPAVSISGEKGSMPVITRKE